MDFDITTAIYNFLCLFGNFYLGTYQNESSRTKTHTIRKHKDMCI